MDLQPITYDKDEYIETVREMNRKYFVGSLQNDLNLKIARPFNRHLVTK